MVFKAKTKFYFLAIIFLFTFSAFGAKAVFLGEVKNFYVDPSYDFKGRKEVSAQMVLETGKLYFYIDNSLWQLFSANEKTEIISNLNSLSSEFENKIYPTLTSNYGPEWNPGIDKDPKITILFHQLKKGAGGYFNSGNEYEKIQFPQSNEREMVYLNPDYITSYLVKGFLAHEFTHLVTFNQKDRIQRTEEDVWLNEARAEYAITLCGYDDQYQGSNLQKRVIEFLKNPNDSLTDWEGSVSDYGALNLFTQYLVDHYGVKILNDSLHHYEKGIKSINQALLANGFKEDFSRIFTDWTIAVLANDCSLGEKYCYKNKNLKIVRILPSAIISIADSSSDVSINYSIKAWAGNWQKISGREGILNVEFTALSGEGFKLSYILCKSADVCSVESLFLDQNGYGKTIVTDFGKYASMVVIPSFQDYSAEEHQSADFSLRVGIENGKSEEELIGQLLSQIVVLQAEVVRLQAEIAAKSGVLNSCQGINSDLYFGLMSNPEVGCLQLFLKNQGSEIYPEGLLTRNFLVLTKAAVIRFQEKYAEDILKPLGLARGTGYVGERTREKINQLISR